MARAATTSDPFNAVAEPQRRKILDLLMTGDFNVTELASRLGMNQPQVSKHLKVLKEVDLITVREEGRQRVYHLNSENLKPIHDWLRPFEQLWSRRLDHLEQVLEGLKKEEHS
ncbi:ArsR/SmtB family transcription factor [Deinococcus cellulosilyticus]|uniref:Putative transcriptional regulator, ArsR family protein n=1 Tax=Deinococcus cellulosilyticus (strain DSM 18568 / NBRC 106333 / KACC 11606 / 5516J-15) TaxID=1223518 RepID=A0A511N059_DEIC1|nr:metalloregulator ArsR/SmtB family transcription factor [Deinococcus cellulosilyticus]GEM46213.1 putative transcriptional regulator, ArsR family protein [Deinococcus cellulosilyticus NBRC 106333 = KACC 11606]